MAYENTPIFTDETPGKKLFCTCGESATKPYCDGSHSEKIQVSPLKNLP
jgi:CDGSH-type Zn-finger protein